MIFYITNVKTIFLNSKGKTKLQRKRNHVDEYVAKMRNINLKSESALDTSSGLDTNEIAIFVLFICRASDNKYSDT